MPSERRLHPLSFLFSLGGQLRQFLIPGLVLLVGAGSAGLDWQGWALLLLVPSAIVAIVQSLSFRYRFDPSELVITSGFIFRNERHVPYARIQNIDAVQNLVHRLLGVVEVRVETGGGDEPEARMSVLPLSALEEMRARVFSGRQPVVSPESPILVPADARRTLLRLKARDLMLYGFIESRGLVIVGTAFGLLWELGLFDGTVDMFFGENASGRGVVRQALRGLFGGGIPSGQIGLTAGAFLVLILVMRVLSMGWALVRLHGFTLARAGDDLRAEYGLFTRVMATMPVHRIQTVTIREGPLHRLFHRTAVRVDSAGGAGGEAAAIGRESLAPIVRREDLPQLLRDLLPEVDVAAVQWNPVDPRGFRRALRGSIFFACLLTVPFVLMLKWWTFVLLALLLVWAYFHARLYVRHLGWALTGNAVLFRSGWLWRHISVARFAKIQAVAMKESPFDRRTRMASVRVDTAGASDLSHRVDVPYLARDTAERVFRLLAGEAARTAFRW